MYANEPLRVCFYVSILYSLLFSSEIILKQLFPSGSVNIKHLMTGPEGNSEFCFPETLNVPRGEAEGNIGRLGVSKLTVSLVASH